MAKAAQRVRDDGAGGAGPGVRSPKRVGRQLRHVRRKQGLSRAEVARSAGLTRRELAAYERGRVEIPDSDLWCLAGSCGVDVAELLPQRDELRIDSELSSLAIGDSIRHLRAPAEPDGLLREYLAMIYELRNLPPDSAIPLRESDLSTLADALGGTPEAIESRLVELIGVNRDEAARLRAMIAPPRALDAGAPSALPTYDPPAHDAPTYAPPAYDLPAFDPPAFDPASPDPYGQGISAEPAPLLDAFLDTPRAEDPFSDPPPLVPAEPIAPFLDATAPPAALDPIAGLPADPFAPMTTDVDVPAATDLAPIADVWTPAPLDLAPADVDAFTTLRPDPFARAHTPADPAMHVPEPDPGIVIDLPDPMPLMPDDTLSPIIPDPERWVTMDIQEATSVAPIAWRAATMAAPDAAMPRLEAPMTAEAEPSIRLQHAGSGWEIGGLLPTTAMADDGALSLRRADTRWALSDLTAPGDVTAEAVVDFTAGAGFGILFRAGLDASGDMYGYSFDLDAVAGTGAYVVRQWEGNRPHWRPLAHTQMPDATRVLGRRTICLAMLGDALTVRVDGETVVTVPSLSQASIELGLQPCRGDRLGIQAAATAEVEVSRFSATQDDRP